MYAKIVNGVVAQVQPDEKDGFIFVGDDVYCGQVFNNGVFENRQPLVVPLEYIEEGKKLRGVEFDGVMCSATSVDQVGLLAVKNWVGDLGGETNFKFSNGNVLRVTPENLSDFEMVWGSFRASFFE